MSESWQEFAKRQSDYAVELERQLRTAERERDEARRERDAKAAVLASIELARAAAVRVAQELRHRAERAERVVEAVAELAQCDVVAGGDYYDDVVVMPVLAAYHRYALDAEAQP